MSIVFFNFSFKPVFTDGSKSINHVGSAAVFNHITLSETLNTLCSVFTSEIYAIYLALKHISEQTYKSWAIYTGSKSVLDALANFSYKSHPLISIVVNLLHKLKDNSFKILFCWVPGHVGIPGNEGAAVLLRLQVTAAAPLLICRMLNWPVHIQLM